jgi:hypothetical protein
MSTVRARKTTNTPDGITFVEWEEVRYRSDASGAAAAGARKTAAKAPKAVSASNVRKQAERLGKAGDALSGEVIDESSLNGDGGGPTGSGGFYGGPK